MPQGISGLSLRTHRRWSGARASRECRPAMTNPVQPSNDAEPSGLKRLVFITLIAIVPVALCLLVLETATYFFYHHANLFPFDRQNPISIAFRQFSRAYRQMVQWDPACSTYNEALGNFTL